MISYHLLWDVWYVQSVHGGKDVRMRQGPVMLSNDTEMKTYCTAGISRGSAMAEVL